MTRQKAIKRAAVDVSEAAECGAVGKPNFFGDPIQAEDVTNRVRSAVDRLNMILAKTDEQWDEMWAASEAEERRVEDDARKFAAGRA